MPISLTMDNNNGLTPIKIMDYIYAILYSSLYRDTYKEFLKIDFPKIPFTKNAKIFKELTGLGSE